MKNRMMFLHLRDEYAKLLTLEWVTRAQLSLGNDPALRRKLNDVMCKQLTVYASCLDLLDAMGKDMRDFNM